MTACALSACTSYKTITGNMNEAVKTMFYSFTVNNCYSTAEINGHLPEDGKIFVVVNVSIENTYKGKLEMTDAHFQMQTLGTDDSSEDTTSEIESGGVSTSAATATAEVDYVLPETQKTEELYLEDELPASYTIDKSETRSGTLIFEMPNTDTIYNFCTADYFNYGTSGNTVTGNTYFVEVTPEAK